MKKMKMKLMASLAMLLVSAIMVTSTSYAWYTINTYATISEMNITLAQTQNVEVAKAYLVDGTKVVMVEEVTTNDSTAKQNTFGGSVQYDTDTVKLELPAKNISDTTNIVWADAADDENADFTAGMAGVVYDENGRTMGFRKATPVTDQTTGLTTYTYKYDEAGTKSATIALSYNMFVRTNTAGDITIDYETDGSAVTGAEISFTVYDMSLEALYNNTGASSTTPATTAAETVTTGDNAYTYALTGLPGISYYYEDKVETGDNQHPARYVATIPSTIVPTTDGTGGNAKSFTAAKDHVYLVQVFAYIDGDDVNALNFNGADFVASLKNIKFTNSNILTDVQDWEDAAENQLTEVSYDASDKKVTALKKDDIVYTWDSANSKYLALYTAAADGDYTPASTLAEGTKIVVVRTITNTDSTTTKIGKTIVIPASTGTD